MAGPGRAVSPLVGGAEHRLDQASVVYFSAVFPAQDAVLDHGLGDALDGCLIRRPDREPRHAMAALTSAG